MPLSARARRLALTTHVTSSVGWGGALIAYLALAIAGLTTGDASKMRAVYVSMELVGWFVIIPLCVASAASGVVESLGTEWGLVRHHWVRTKLGLTLIASIVLFVHMRVVRQVSGLAAHMPSFPTADLHGTRIQLVVHAAGGLVVLLAAIALSFYKPWGRTAYGERMARRVATPRTATKVSSRVIVMVLVVAALASLAIAHLHGGPRHH